MEFLFLLPGTHPTRRRRVRNRATGTTEMRQHTVVHFRNSQGQRKVRRLCSSTRYGWVLIKRGQTRSTQIPPIERVVWSRIGVYKSWLDAYHSFKDRFQHTDGKWKASLRQLTVTAFYKALLVKTPCKRCVCSKYVSYESTRCVFDYRLMGPSSLCVSEV